MRTPGPKIRVHAARRPGATRERRKRRVVAGRHSQVVRRRSRRLRLEGIRHHRIAVQRRAAAAQKQTHQAEPNSRIVPIRHWPLSNSASISRPHAARCERSRRGSGLASRKHGPPQQSFRRVPHLPTPLVVAQRTHTPAMRKACLSQTAPAPQAARPRLSSAPAAPSISLRFVRLRPAIRGAGIDSTRPDSGSFIAGRGGGNITTAPAFCRGCPSAFSRPATASP